MFPRIAALWLILGMPFLLPSVAGGQKRSGFPGETRYAGLTLTEALLDLQRRGLEILFTSQVVRPEMRVAAEPGSDSLRGALDELLEPHGLEAREGPGGTLVVVPLRGPAVIRGSVRERGTYRPLEGVQILIPDAELETVSDENGAFSIPEAPVGTHTLEAHRPGFVVESLAAVEALAGRVTEVAFELVPAPVPVDEIIVTPSLILLLGSDPVAALALDRDEIVALPHLGDDLFRALTLLPGISGEEFSAQFQIRGGRSDEVLVMLDQLELFDPYHLRDFESGLSIIAPQAIAEVELSLGGFPVRFGDRMSGVLDMRTVTPSGERTNHLGIDLFNAKAGGSGRFHEDRGQWLGVARYGFFELTALAFDLGTEERPRYWDAFGKLEYQLASGNRIGVRLLHADDRLDFVLAEEEGLEQAHTTYGNTYFWMTHQALLSPHFFVDSVISRGRLDRDRQGEETVEEELELFVFDQRALDVTGFKQDWNYRSSERNYLRWGFDFRRLDSEYDYRNDRGLETILEDIRFEPPSGTTVFSQRFRGEQVGVYVSDRLRLAAPLTVELGLRYDEHTVTGDQDLSPRVNLVAAIGKTSTLRAAWGHYTQSQRLYELQVEDGETEFSTAELTEQYGLGFEHLFEKGATLRVDLYHRDVSDPRPRFENIFEPVSKFPETEPDRARIAPERSTSQGVELFYRGRRDKKIDWWVNYTWSRVEDVIDGRDTPRGFDQPHTFNADVSYRVGDHWTVNLAFRYHTGWPTTAVTGRLEENDEGELEPVAVFGPLYGERLSDYHRLDLRASREWRVKKGTLSLFIDLQNLYHRQNLAGFDVDEFEFDFDEEMIPEGAKPGDPIAVLTREETWKGLVPSFGIDWKF